MAVEDRGPTPGTALVDIERVESMLATLRQDGHAPILALGVVPLPELAAVNLGIFVEAGAVSPPAWEGWLALAVADVLRAGGSSARVACWDASIAHRWTVAWTEDDGPLVAWTPAGGRLRIADGVVDVLDEGRWTVVPIVRLKEVSVTAQGSPGQALRLHMKDGRVVPFNLGHRENTANLVAQRVATVLGVPWKAVRRLASPDG
ncbi:MAG: hypothetical protein GXP62_08020, partial [Oligoflexia bacterium]|nr:hypothetical protein [Oligoflexia bacterium]